MATRVVHCKKEPYDILIDRTGPLGNPFVIGRDGTREEVIAKHKQWLFNQPVFVSLLRHLKGKTLGCWCAPLPCHGDIYAFLADTLY